MKDLKQCSRGKTVFTLLSRVFRWASVAAVTTLNFVDKVFFTVSPIEHRVEENREMVRRYMGYRGIRI